MTLRRSVLTAALVGGLSMTPAAGCRSSPSDSGARSAASSALSEISGGVPAPADVEAGPAALDADGRATSRLTVKNSTGDQHDYTISVIFDVSGGGLPDVVVVDVSKVPAHGQSHATAKSTRKLSGTVTAKVSAAVRH